MSRKCYAVYARNSSPLHEGSLTSCVQFIAACMNGYTTLTICEIAK